VGQEKDGAPEIRIHETWQRYKQRACMLGFCLMTLLKAHIMTFTLLGQQINMNLGGRVFEHLFGSCGTWLFRRCNKKIKKSLAHKDQISFYCHPFSPESALGTLSNTVSHAF
jgi:hypothetical protein